jgi:hypothetical protein
MAYCELVFFHFFPKIWYFCEITIFKLLLPWECLGFIFLHYFTYENELESWNIFSSHILFGALNLIMSSKLGLQQFSNDLKKVQFEQGLVFNLHWSKYLGHLKTSKSQIGNSFENFRGLFFTFSQSYFSLKKCVLKKNHSTLY